MEKCMQEIGTVHKQGFLTKSPPVTQLNSLKHWKRKYFVILQINPDKGNIFRNASQKGKGDIAIKDLHEFYLVYWESDDEKKKIGSQSLSAIPLLGHYHTHKYSLYEQKYANVVILVTDNRVYFLTAESEEEMESWFFHLNRTLSLVRSKQTGEESNICQDGSGEEDKDHSAAEDYYERVDLPDPVPRESWTLPKRLEMDNEGEYEGMTAAYDLREEVGPTSPHNTLLSRCSFGSVHGYHSHERSPSSSTQVNELTTSSDDNDMKSDHLYAVEKDEHENASVITSDNNNNNGGGIENPASKLHIHPLFPPPPPPLPQELPLKLPSSPQKNEMRDILSNLQKGRKEYNTYELYKFLKGPEFTMLSLFDCDVKLPSDTVANVTNDGLQMSYGDHEIIIRRIRKKLSDDIIEV